MAAALDRLLLTTIQTFVYYSKPAPDWKLSHAQIDIPGLCLGQILPSETSEDMVACWSLCTSTESCAWFSFDTTEGQTCILFETCPEIESNPQFVSGQKECDYSNG